MLSVCWPETLKCIKVVINKLEEMWQDAFVILFKVLSRLARGGNE